MAKKRSKKHALKRGKTISDPSGDDKMVGGKLTDPKHDDRIVARKSKRSKKKVGKRSKKRVSHR